MKKTWLLGFGFFSISMTWALYNAFVPYFLESFLESTALIGFMMTIDNYFALFLQPWIGNRSDRTNTRFGKRMPYLIIGMPLAAVFTALIPWHTTLWMLVLFMMLMNLSMSLYRSPTIALMPDITPDSRRSQANGIINFMGGIAAILAFGAGSYLYEQHPSLPFLTSAAVTLLCLLILIRTINERRDAVAFVPAEKANISLRGEWTRPTVFLLAAIFFWFVAYQGVEALFTLYGTNHLGLTKGEAAFSLSFFSLTFVLGAIPSGWLGRRFGKKRIIMIGVSGLAAVFLAVTFVNSLFMLRALLVLGGWFWSMININSYPFVVSLGKEESIGTRTGMYYLVSSLAAIASPPLLGAFVDGFGYGSLFYSAFISMVLALLCMAAVRHSGTTTENRNLSVGS